MDFEEEYQTPRLAKDSVKAKTVELGEGIGRARAGAHKFFISEETRRITAEKSLNATVLRLLQRRSKRNLD